MPKGLVKYYVVRFSAPEFTSLCAVTGQPAFAHFIIDYVPKTWLLESKSVKFFLASFRNHSSFHEECTIAIGKRLAAAIRPTYFCIAAYWHPRGGIPIDVFWEKENGRRGCACQIKASPLSMDADNPSAIAASKGSWSVGVRFAQTSSR